MFVNLFLLDAENGIYDVSRVVWTAENSFVRIDHSHAVDTAFPGSLSKRTLSIVAVVYKRSHYWFHRSLDSLFNFCCGDI
jgi:hypothetical protein